MRHSWLKTSTYREKYRFLEEHQELLYPDVDVQLEIEIGIVTDNLQQTPDSASEGISKVLQRRFYGLEVLREVRERGGTAEAIRAVYIDRYGGLVLDVPPWLETISQQLDTLPDLNLPSRATAGTKISLLLDAIVRAQGDHSVAPETMAELQGKLGDAIGAKYADKAQEVIDLYRMALQVYTLAHYPHQHARIQANLGSIYAISSKGDQLDILEQAITCWEAALQFYTQDAFPDQWAEIQVRLRSAYGRRRKLKEQSDDEPDGK